MYAAAIEAWEAEFERVYRYVMERMLRHDPLALHFWMLDRDDS